MKTVREVRVKDVEKRKYPSKHYVYVIEVTWSEGTSTTIYRRYTDFFEFQCKLLELFPNEAGTKDPTTRMIPFLPGKILLGRSQIRSVAEKRKEKIDEYCRALIRLPPKISDCEHILNFFEVTPEDINPPEDKMNSKGKQAQIESITGPIVLERYVALADYAKQKKNECSLKEGQMVEVIDKNQNGWWFVNLDDCNEGWVPATYLEPIYGTEEAQSEVLTQGEEQTHITTAGYKAQNEDEISFEKGVLMEVFEKNVDGWWKARYGGRDGFVPAAYLARYRATTTQGAAPVGVVPTVRDALSPTSERKTIQDHAPSPQGPTQKKPGYDDEPIYCHIPRKKSIDKKPIKAALTTASRRVPPEVPKSRDQKEEEGEEEEEGGDPPKELYITLADFSATAGDGVSFKAGETVSVVTKNQSGWWYVEINNTEGWVPSSYLEKKTTPIAPTLPKLPSNHTASANPKMITKKPEVATSSSPPPTTPSVSKSQSFEGDPSISGGVALKPKMASKTPTPARHNVSGLKKTKSSEDLLDAVDAKPVPLKNVSDKKDDNVRKPPPQPSLAAKKSLQKPSVEAVDSKSAVATPTNARPDVHKPVTRKSVPSETTDPEPHPHKPFNMAATNELEKSVKKPLAKVLSADIVSSTQKPQDGQIGTSRSTSSIRPDPRDIRLPPSKPEPPAAEKAAHPKRPNPPSIQKGSNKAPPPRPENSPSIVKKSTYTTICDYEGGLEGCIEFKEKEEVTEVIEKKDDGWWFIRIGSREGWAPSTFLDEIKIKSPPPKAKTGPFRPDTGPVRPDTGPVRPKTGPVRPDTGSVKRDTGPVRPDTGPVRPDTGPVRPDTGPVRPKTGPVRPDTGPARPDFALVKPKKPSIKTANLFKAIETYHVSSSEDNSSTCIDLVKGMVYEVMEKGDGWWFVRSTDNKEGWVPSTYLDPM